MIADWAGDASTGPFDPGTTFAAYHGQVPGLCAGHRLEEDHGLAATSAPRSRAAARSCAGRRRAGRAARDADPRRL